MLVIKGKSGKSVFLAEKIIRPLDMIIETHEGLLSRLLPEDDNTNDDDDNGRIILQIPSNEDGDVDAILRTLESFMKNVASEFEDDENYDPEVDRVIFYLNVDFDKEKLKKFVDLENKFNITTMVTVQGDNDELEFYGFGKDGKKSQ